MEKIVPIYDQLCNVIKHTDDSIDQTLVLYRTGKFGTVGSSEIWQYNPNVIGGKVFVGGGGYFGFEPNTKDNEEYIDSLYHASLICWRDHVITGRFGFSIDRASYSSDYDEIINLISEIKAITP